MPSPDLAISYHERTKHHPHRFARSMGYLDWDSQPDPFRRFEGAGIVRLPLVTQALPPSPSYDDLFGAGPDGPMRHGSDRNGEDPNDSRPYASEPLGVERTAASRIPPRAASLASIASFFENALAISAWKQAGSSRWALRVNPSSGNLHPTEGYLVAGPLEGLAEQGGVYHYAPREHALERRTSFAAETWQSLVRNLPAGVVLIGLSSIHWRESWKYGERAYRYCQHDVGHALAALGFAAAMQGWEARFLSDLGDEDVARLLGLDRAVDFEDAEREQPDLLLAVFPRGAGGFPGSGAAGAGARAGASVSARTGAGEGTGAGAGASRSLSRDAIEEIARGTWMGKANRLSPSHVEWEVIDEVAAACVKPPGGGDPRGGGSAMASGAPAAPPPPAGSSHLPQGPRSPKPAPVSLPVGPHRATPARTILQGRRSATDFDGATSIPTESFYTMVCRVFPTPSHPALGVLAAPALLDLVFFLHRVEGLPPGLYVLVRSADRVAALREAMRDSFAWRKPEGCPAGLPLFLLAEGDHQSVARGVSCGQEIASDGAFALAMLAAFEEPLRRHGSWFYRRMHWEAGAIGQVLYLEAEAAGLRGTGIGCFFDDAVHDRLGLTGRAFQSLYHFTVGGPVEDPRLTTLPPYPPGMRGGAP